MTEGRCCDCGNFPRTCLSGSRLSWPRLEKARSGLVPTFQGERRNWLFPLGYKTVQGCWMLPRSPGSHRPGCCVITPVDVLAIEVANVQAGVWERRDGRWSESRAWRFVDIDDLVSCYVYAQPLSL